MELTEDVQVRDFAYEAASHKAPPSQTTDRSIIVTTPSGSHIDKSSGLLPSTTPESDTPGSSSDKCASPYALPYSVAYSPDWTLDAASSGYYQAPRLAFDGTRHSSSKSRASENSNYSQYSTTAPRMSRNSHKSSRNPSDGIPAVPPFGVTYDHGAAQHGYVPLTPLDESELSVPRGTHIVRKSL